jgi:hypothetical protein
MKLKEFAELVRAMRDAQKRYWNLSKDDPGKRTILIESKTVEAKVDRALDDILGSDTAALFH